MYEEIEFRINLISSNTKIIGVLFLDNALVIFLLIKSVSIRKVPDIHRTVKCKLSFPFHICIPSWKLSFFIFSKNISVIHIKKHKYFRENDETTIYYSEILKH